MVKKAIILMNMGGASNYDEIEVFIRNMFNDHRIIGVPPFMRKNFANYITKIRLAKAKSNLQKIGGKSPLLSITQSLQKRLQKKIDDAKVKIIMRYTSPFAKDVLKRLKEERIEKLYLIPMYPQFSTTTTASSIEDIRKTAKDIGYHPTIVSCLHYYDFKPFLEIVEERIIERVGSNDPKKLDLIFSAHGLPVCIIKKGDPYQKQIEAEVALHIKRLKQRGVEFNQVHLAYQSKVGPLKWLTPSLKRVLEKIKNKKVLIYPISFTIDNSETLFELNIEYRKIAQKLGFQTYEVCSCPNDSDSFIQAIKALYDQMK